MKFGIIDIGSNSVRLMVWANGTSFFKRIKTTRLAEGLSERKELSEEAMNRTAEAVREFYEIAVRENAQPFAFATAAVRSARNGDMFCRLAETECGLKVDVVSGEEEAELALLGALGGGDGAILDIGGASTEYAVRKDGKTVFSVSLPVGCVRLYETCGEDKERLAEAVGEVLRVPLPSPGGKVFAVGGTASTLASVNLGLSEYDKNRLDGLLLTRDWVKSTSRRLLSLGVKERKAIPGMDPRRADIIAGGALLLSDFMEKLSLGGVFFSDRDNLEGYLSLRRLI